MKRSESSVLRNVVLWCLAAALCGLAGGIAPAFAQFGLKLPKIPKVGKKDKEKAKESERPAPQISKITPDSAPPGGLGELVLIGKNLTPDIRFRLRCPGGEVSAKGFKVESAERATVQLKVPEDTGEGACAMDLVRVQGAPPPEANETDEVPAGTPEITTIEDSAGLFKISNSGTLPVGLEVILFGEGDMNFMEMMQKIQQEMVGGSTSAKMKPGQLLIMPDSLKYLQDGQTVFAEPPSAVKSVDEMTMMGEPQGVFRIVFNNGKIYNFSALGMNKEVSHKDVQLLKRRLGK
jgi:hypothetical protein